MFLCIDIGGTKTAVAVFDDSGKVSYESKIKTDHNYDIFLKNLASLIKNDIKDDIKYACAAVPGLLDRENGIVISLGNLPWRNIPIRDDIEKLISCKLVIENDTRLGGLGEARAYTGKYKRLVYFTVSTGIGGALIIDKRISEDMRDMEIGKAPLLNEDGQIQDWENIASGRALYEKYGIRADEITDEKIWKEIAEKIAHGIGIACAVLQPEVIIFGGGVGQYADKFTPYIKDYLEENLHPNINQPKELSGPNRAEDSVLYGCYELLKDHAK